MLAILVGAYSCLVSANTASHAEDGITETRVESFGYELGTKNNNMRIQNVVPRPNGADMRKGVHKESMMRWEAPNSTTDWAFEFTISDISLAAVEHAEIFLRYTAEKPLVGTYKGGQAEFNGMMAGLVFIGRAVNIFYVKNDGKDLRPLGDIMARRDYMDPRRLTEGKDIKIKIISTEKNLKMEIYQDDLLIYDNFRVYNMEKEGLNTPGKYFSITAFYPDAPSGKSFILKHAQLYKRVEGSEYKPIKHNSTVLNEGTVDREDVKHYDKSIADAIYQIRLLMAYTKKIFGNLPDTTLETLERDVKKEITQSGEKIEKLTKEFKEQSKHDHLQTRINDIDLAIVRAQKGIQSAKYQLHRAAKQRGAGVALWQYVLLALGCFVLGGYAHREIAQLISQAKLENKK